MRKKLIILTAAAAILAALTGCTTEKAVEKEKTGELKLTATAEKFEKPEYIIKKGEPVTLVFDSRELLSEEIKGMSLKLDKETPSKQIKPDSPGVYDITGHLGEGKTIKARLTVIE
jgi:cytochrome c oxidase subunit 2